MTLTLHKNHVHSAGIMHGDFAFHSRSLLFLKRRLRKLRGLFYSWSLLRNNNTATNLQKFTSSYGSRRFVACDCWTVERWHLGR